MSTLQGQRERINGAYNEFESDMIRDYPKSQGNIPRYILIQLSKCKEGSKNHLKWSMLYDSWCDHIGSKSRINEAITRTNNQALSIIQ